MTDTSNQLLSERESAFVDEYLLDLNGTQAMLRANPGITRDSAAVQASRMLRRPRIIKRIQALQHDRSRRLQIEADDVVIRLWRIATADPRELVNIHVFPCDECIPQAGRNAHREAAPNPSCPGCAGGGVARLVLSDTRHVSESGAALLAGVRRTRRGIEILLKDQLKALELVGRHFGIWQTDAHEAPASSDPLAELLRELHEQHKGQREVGDQASSSIGQEGTAAGTVKRN